MEQLPAQWAAAADLAARYLAGLWKLPNYDCWEEFAEKVHPHTLAAIYGGLQAYDALLGQPVYANIAAGIRDFVLNEGAVNGHFVKYLGTEMVDASLLGLATPYGLVSPEHPLMQATVARIESDLRPLTGGVRRYAQDTYYGGGQWLLLTAWLGWHYAQSGEKDRAKTLLDWVAAQADKNNYLSEQIAAELISPPHYQPWVDMRGPIANPLLWSHAMYLVLAHALA
jgi:GH15 family glucan-1,4-alpha-glucosidase